MSEEEKLLLKRLLDLSRKSESSNRTLFSDFLNMGEVDLFLCHQQEMYTGFRLFGGYGFSERQMIAFIPEALSFDREDIVYPISCLQISPRHEKYAETLSHRDVLGACMHLGIERKLLGDILVQDTFIYVFCCERIVPFLLEELKRIKHTDVTVNVFDGEVGAFSPRKEAISKTIAAARLDCLVAAGCGISRSEAAKQIQAKLVFVNARTCVKPDYSCAEQDVISVRGYGKFALSAITGMSKKGKTKVVIEKYV